MIRIKTASNETKEITKVYVKTGASTVKSISEAFQVYDNNGVKALKRVFGYDSTLVELPITAECFMFESSTVTPGCFFEYALVTDDLAIKECLARSGLQWKALYIQMETIDYKEDHISSGRSDTADLAIVEEYDWVQCHKLLTVPELDLVYPCARARVSVYGITTSDIKSKVYSFILDAYDYFGCINDSDDFEHSSYCDICNRYTESHTCSFSGNFIVDMIPATCTESGSYYIKCDDCSEKEGPHYTNPLGHDFSNNAEYCRRDGCDEENPDYKEPSCNHTGGTATCITQAICSKCGEPYGSLADHTKVTDPAVAPTCTTAGKTEGKHCSACGKVLVAQTVVKALGHTEVTDAAVAATCTTAGKTEGKHCSACGEVLVAQNSVPAKGHTPNKGWWTDGPYGSHWHSCSDCGQRYDKASHSHGAWTPSTIRANQHYKECTICKLGDADIYEQCSDYYKTHRPATCTENRKDICTKCGRIVEQGGTKTNHTYSICTHHFASQDTYTAECEFCGKTITGDIILDEFNMCQRCPNCGETFGL